AEPDFTVSAIERVVRGLTEELSLKLVDLAQLARLAATGRTASPPIFDVLALIGRDESLARLARAREGAEGAAWGACWPPPGSRAGTRSGSSRAPTTSASRTSAARRPPPSARRCAPDTACAPRT